MELGFIIGAISFGILVLAGVVFCWQNRDTPASNDDPNRIQPGDEIPDDQNPN